MNKKLVSFIGLMALATSCSIGHKNASARKPITRIPEKILTETKPSETYIDKEKPETPEELEATSAVKVTPALIRQYIETYKDIAMVATLRNPRQYHLSTSHLGEWFWPRPLGSACS